MSKPGSDGVIWPQRHAQPWTEGPSSAHIFSLSPWAPLSVPPPLSIIKSPGRHHHRRPIIECSGYEEELHRQISNSSSSSSLLFAISKTCALVLAHTRVKVQLRRTYHADQFAVRLGFARSFLLEAVFFVEANMIWMDQHRDQIRNRRLAHSLDVCLQQYTSKSPFLEIW